MAVDMYIKIKGIDGESKDDKHKNEIDVLAWSWGMSQSGSFHVGGGGGSGKVHVNDLSFTKYIDISSPVLMLTCSNGDHIPEATLTVRKAGKSPLEYITIKMEKIIVANVSTGGSGGEDRLTENVTLNFAKVSFKYVQQGDKGAEDKKKQYKWDIEANKGDVS
jgi:type VI secretion system secreted protein Hcp